MISISNPRWCFRLGFEIPKCHEHWADEYINLHVKVKDESNKLISCMKCKFVALLSFDLTDGVEIPLVQNI